MRRLLFLALLLLLPALPATLSSAPSLPYLYPAGGAAGTTFKVSVGSKTTPWPIQAWCSHPDIVFTPTTNKGTFVVTVATNCPPGP